jgi:hypothetical protein
VLVIVKALQTNKQVHGKLLLSLKCNTCSAKINVIFTIITTHISGVCFQE